MRPLTLGQMVLATARLFPHQPVTCLFNSALALTHALPPALTVTASCAIYSSARWKHMSDSRERWVKSVCVTQRAAFLESMRGSGEFALQQRRSESRSDWGLSGVDLPVCAGFLHMFSPTVQTQACWGRWETLSWCDWRTRTCDVAHSVSAFHCFMATKSGFNYILTTGFTRVLSLRARRTDPSGYIMFYFLFLCCLSTFITACDIKQPLMYPSSTLEIFKAKKKKRVVFLSSL